MWVALANFIWILIALYDCTLLRKYKRLKREVDRTLDKAEKLVPPCRVTDAIINADEFIIIARDKNTGDWYLSKNCSSRAFEAYCPSLFRYYKDGGDALKEVQKIINP